MKIKKEKKVIFFVKNFTFGGVEKVLITSVNALSSAGWKVTIVWTGHVEEDGMKKEILPVVKQLYASKLWHIPDFIRQWKRLPKFLCKIFYKAEVMMNKYLPYRIPDFSTYRYVIDFRNGSSLLYRLPLMPQQKRIVWMHGSFENFFRKDKFNRHRIFDYDKVVCLTEAFKKRFTEVYPQSAGKIVRIYNPVDLSPSLINVDEQKTCKDYAPYFVHVSRIDVDKDIATVLNAYERFLKQTASDTKLVFIGDGLQLSHFKEKLRQKNLSDKIIFYGRSNNPLTWMKNAKALILSSKAEGLPTVLIEGQICGTLVISSDCREGPAEILQHGKSGLLFPVGDDNALADILADVERGKINPAPYVKNAFAALHRFSLQEFVRKFNQLG